MSDIKALEDLRVYANGWRNGFGGHPSDVDTLADRIGREVSQRVAELNGAICERDGRIGSYERRNTELNDALKAICKRFGVSTEWSAEDTAKKVLDALEQGWMELPVDADGVPIRIGDTLEGAPGSKWDGERFEVGGIELTTYGWEVCDAETCDSIAAGQTRHVKHLTIEDAISDAIRDYATTDMSREEIAAKYAEEIRGMMA